jgi:hypothetical protein
MGAMTLTLYTAHLLALAPEVHYDQPGLWFALQVGVAAVFAWCWTRYVGRGPLEMVVVRAVAGARDLVADGTPGTPHGGPAGDAADRSGPGAARHQPGGPSAPWDAGSPRG